MEPEICMKMPRNVSGKLTAKFSKTTLSYSMVKIAHLKDAFSEIFELEKGTVSRRSISAAKRRKMKGKKSPGWSQWVKSRQQLAKITVYSMISSDSVVLGYLSDSFKKRQNRLCTSNNKATYRVKKVLILTYPWDK